MQLGSLLAHVICSVDVFTGFGLPSDRVIMAVQALARMAAIGFVGVQALPPSFNTFTISDGDGSRGYGSLSAAVYVPVGLYRVPAVIVVGCSLGVDAWGCQVTLVSFLAYFSVCVLFLQVFGF